ncbi:hypothetical protein [Alcanivorax sp.]|uniref:hypothetical protein n=1 Tax=Alcanivorax sp. TaxID=1872427 RepID=UPI0025844B3A|nr:hypothetical protein [Alcanivorax sp.]
MRKTILVTLIAGSLAGCASSPSADKSHPAPKPMVNKRASIPDQRVPLSPIPLSGKLDYGYRLSGDPYVLPEQVFSDDKFLYLMLKKGQMPPLATTRDGKLLESEVRRGFVILPKADSVVLRIGSRKGYVNRKGLKIVSLRPVPKAPEMPLVLDVDVSRPDSDRKGRAGKKGVVIRLDPYKASSLPEPGVYRACAFPSVSAYRALSKLKQRIASAGGEVLVLPSCWVKVKKDEIVLERVK